MPSSAESGRSRPRFHAIRMLAAGLLSALGLCFGSATGAVPTPAPAAVVLTVDGVIGRGAADYVLRGFAAAAERRGALVVIELDTPGGLDGSMRDIIRAILGSSVPVAVYVAPSGARAASAGTYIVYASHVAAMAPGTNLGAATPIRISAGGSAEPEPDQAKKDAGASASAGVNAASTETNKQVQDAAAYIRGLAQLRG